VGESLRSSVPTWDAPEWVGHYIAVFPHEMRLSGWVITEAVFPHGICLSGWVIT
jgi:hypothetical protein